MANKIDLLKYYAKHELKIGEEACTFDFAKRSKFVYMIAESDIGFNAYSACENGKVKLIGTLGYKVKKNKLLVVYVEAKTQHEGIGTALLERAKQIARLNGCNKMYLHSVSDAEGFYEKLGFEKGQARLAHLFMREYSINPNKPFSNI